MRARSRGKSHNCPSRVVKHVHNNKEKAEKKKERKGKKKKKKGIDKKKRRNIIYKELDRKASKRSIIPAQPGSSWLLGNLVAVNHVPRSP